MRLLEVISNYFSLAFTFTSPTRGEGKSRSSKSSIFVFLAFLCYFGSGVCSDSDLEKVPLLQHQRSVNNDNNALIPDQDVVEDRSHQLEEVVVYSANRSPRGILLPREGGQLCAGNGRDIWLVILSMLEQKDLMSMRRVNIFFHNLLTQPGNTPNPMGENFLINLAEARLNAQPPSGNLSPAARMAHISNAFINLRENERLTAGFRAYLLEKLKPYVGHLWRLRFTPGMNVGDLRLLLEALDLPVDNSWRSWYDARQLASLHPGRFKGWITELAKAGIVLSSAGVGLWLIWTKPFLLPVTCKTIYAFPAAQLASAIPINTSADLDSRITNSIFVGLNLFAYLPTLSRNTFGHFSEAMSLKCRGWGKTPTYDEWVGILERRDHPPSVRARRWMSYGVIPILTLGMTGAVGYFYLSVGQHALFSAPITMARYIHEELQHNLPKNASCCAIAVDKFLGSYCPYIDPNSVQNWGQLIPTVAFVNGFSSMNFISFSVVAFQTLFTMALLTLSFS